MTNWPGYLGDDNIGLGWSGSTVVLWPHAGVAVGVGWLLHGFGGSMITCYCVGVLLGCGGSITTVGTQYPKYSTSWSLHWIGT